MKTVLLTGASGFLGRVLLNEMTHKHKVITLGRRESDIAWIIPQPLNPLPPVDCVVHAAGLAHQMRAKPNADAAMMTINDAGTRLLLKALEVNPPRQFVFISTVAVYGRDEGENIDESHPLNGVSAYARSKIAAEKAVLAWGAFHNVHTLVLRLPLIAGVNPPGNLAAMIRAIRKRYYVRIGKGTSRKSMVGARAVASFIAGLKGNESGVYNLTDGVHPTVSAIEVRMAQQLKRRVKSVPLGLAAAMGRIGDRLPASPVNTMRIRKLTGTLTFSDEKARSELNWKPDTALNELMINEKNL